MDPRWNLTAVLCCAVVGAGWLVFDVDLGATPPPPVAPVVLPPPAPEVAAPPPPEPVLSDALPPGDGKRDVDLAVLIDTSGSMKGLLDSARVRLWGVIAEVAEREPNAHLRLALYSYGDARDGSAEDGFIVLRSELSDDLDAVYERLSALEMEGDQEYVGMAIERSVVELNWSEQDGAARIIFVAGNESAWQGPVDATDAVDHAQRRGVKVSTLYAGRELDGVGLGWEELALRGNAPFVATDVRQAVRQHQTPVDSEIERLNSSFNDTFLPYGRHGAAGLESQRRQDDGARALGVDALTSRVAAKTSGVYNNSGWDLVDASAGGLDLGLLPTDDLPFEMRSMTPDQRRAHVLMLAGQREDLRGQLKVKDDERKGWIESVFGSDYDASARFSAVAAAVS